MLAQKVLTVSVSQLQGCEFNRFGRICFKVVNRDLLIDLAEENQ